MPRRRSPREFRPSSAGGEGSGTRRRAFRRRLRTPAPARRSSRRAPFRARPGERCTAADTSCRNRSPVRNHSIVSWQSTSRASICLRREGGAFRRRGMPARLRKPHGGPFGAARRKRDRGKRRCVFHSPPMRPVPEWGRALRSALLQPSRTAAKPFSRSAMMSSMCSVPMDRRMVLGLMP